MNKYFVILTFTFLVACSSSPTQFPAAAPTATNPSPPLPTQTESSFGPWLMLPGPDGLWAYDTANEMLSLIEDQHLLAPQNVNAMPAPGGGHVAFITGENGIENLTLNILSLPPDLAQTQTLIAPEYFPEPDASPGDPAMEAVRALFEATSIAWSPDGQAIAFIGLLEGPTADIYLLPLANLESPPGAGRILRLTDGPSQAISPIWSPDGQYIVHVGVETFGSGAGYRMTSVWAARTDGKEVKTLYDASESGGESFIGWLDASTLVVHSRASVCGNENLRTVNIENGSIEILWEYPFNAVALDPMTGNILISVDTYTANCTDNVLQGLYFLPGSGGSPTQVTEEEAFLPTWDKTSGFFLARTPTIVLAVGPGGSAFQLQAPEPSLPAANQTGQFAWASARTGIWLANLGEPASQIYTQPAFTPAWSPDGKSLYFFGSEGLYAATGPSFEPVLIGEGRVSGGVFWLNP